MGLDCLKGNIITDKAKVKLPLNIEQYLNNEGLEYITRHVQGRVISRGEG
jgi:hypothetical protein